MTKRITEVTVKFKITWEDEVEDEEGEGKLLDPVDWLWPEILMSDVTEDTGPLLLGVEDVEVLDISQEEVNG